MLARGERLTKHETSFQTVPESTSLPCHMPDLDKATAAGPVPLRISRVISVVVYQCGMNVCMDGFVDLSLSKILFISWLIGCELRVNAIRR